jgi:hypothetical protein
MLFFFAFHFSLSLTPNCRNWSPNYSVLVLVSMQCEVSWKRRFCRLYQLPLSGATTLPLGGSVGGWKAEYRVVIHQIVIRTLSEFHYLRQ